MVRPYERYLENIYFDPKHPASFAGLDKLYRIVRKEGKFVLGKAKLLKWLENQESFLVHQQIRRRFKRRKVITPYMDYQWEMDVANMYPLRKWNDGFPYFLVVIDTFSKFVWTRKLKTKNGVEMVNALSTLLKEGRTPAKIHSDKGTEFVNLHVKRLLKDKKIDFFQSQNSVKCAIVERSIKTIKMKLKRIMSFRQSHRWVDDLKSVTESYNNTYHRSIKKAPANISNKDSVRLWKLHYGINSKVSNKQGKRKHVKYKFKIGDTVKISHLRNIFSREYDERWTTEIFMIVSRTMKEGLPVYTIKDFNNEMITGTFYQNELHGARVDDNTTYKIEKVLKHRVRNRRKEVLVKWMGWPKTFNTWIPESEVKKL